MNVTYPGRIPSQSPYFLLTKGIERSPCPPCKGKAFLYRARDTRVQAIDDETLSEIILTQEEQEPFWSVEEL